MDNQWMRMHLKERHETSVEQVAKRLETALVELVPGIKASDYLHVLKAVCSEREKIPEYTQPTPRWP